MKILRRLSTAAVLVAFSAAVLGSWTRINGAGMTCPDWPLCHGLVIPSMADGTVWEWTHRLCAFAVAPLVLAVIFTAWRLRSRSPLLTPLFGTIASLFVLQVFLGAATVHLSNSPISVVLHWGTAMAFIAALTATAIVAGLSERPATSYRSAEAAVTGALAGTAFVAFVTMCVGAYVSSSGAGLACLSLPGCAGNVVVFSQGQYVQILHRLVAAATLACAAIAFALVWARSTSTHVRAATSLGLALVFAQIVLGLMNVAWRLPMDLREAHAANAALVFLSFVAATCFAAFDASDTVQRAAVRTS